MTREAYGEDEHFDEADEPGIAIPATMALLGLGFIGCALVIAGLPPLSGFIAKFALLTAALNPSTDLSRRRLGYAAGANPVGTGDAYRDDPRGYPYVLGFGGPRCAARAFNRDDASCAPFSALRTSDDPGRSDHALHAGHSPIAPHAS